MDKKDVDKSKDKTVWLDDHTQLMLALYYEINNQKGKSVIFKRQIEKYNFIAQQMRKRGLTYSGLQISNKLKSIRRSAKKRKQGKQGKIINEPQLEINYNNEKSIPGYCRVCQYLKSCEIELTDKVANIPNIDTYLDCYNFVLNTNITFESVGAPHKLCVQCCNDLLVAYNFCLKAQKIEKQITVESPIDLPDDDPLISEENIEDDNHSVVVIESDEDISKECTNTTSDSVDGLLEHEQVVHEPKKHVCKFCGKVFKEKPYLSRHIKRHNTDGSKKVFKCDYCERSYTSKYSLKYHQRSHLGKTSSCNICQKEFIWKNDLIRHMSFHTKDFPFKCEQCGRKFAISSHLKQHYLKHNNMRCECPICGKQFFVAHSLYKHYYKHTGLMPYPCCYCKRQYPSSSSYKHHLKMKHDIEATDMDMERSRMKVPKDKLVKPKIKWVKSKTLSKNYKEYQQKKIASNEIDIDEMEWMENKKSSNNYIDDQQIKIESDDIDIDEMEWMENSNQAIII